MRVHISKDELIRFAFMKKYGTTIGLKEIKAKVYILDGEILVSTVQNEFLREL